MRRGQLVAVGALLLLGATACQDTSETPTAEATLTPCEDTRRVDALWGDHVLEGDDTTVWVVGDSWTIGWPLEDPTDAWVSTFAELTGYTVRVDGWSASGYTVSGLCEEEDTTFPTRVRRAAAEEPDLIVVQGGLNDVGVREGELADAVDAVLEAAGEIPVVLLGPGTAPALPPDGIRAVDEVLADAAGDTARHVSALEWELDYLPDGAHPSLEGAQELGELAAKEIGPDSASGQM
jgi:lysophospholipase L1-like esterase